MGFNLLHGLETLLGLQQQASNPKNAPPPTPQLPSPIPLNINLHNIPKVALNYNGIPDIPENLPLNTKAYKFTNNGPYYYDPTGGKGSASFLDSGNPLSASQGFLAMPYDINTLPYKPLPTLSPIKPPIR